MESEISRLTYEHLLKHKSDSGRVVCKLDEKINKDYGLCPEYIIHPLTYLTEDEAKKFDLIRYLMSSILRITGMPNTRVFWAGGAARRLLFGPSHSVKDFDIYLHLPDGSSYRAEIERALYHAHILSEEYNDFLIGSGSYSDSRYIHFKYSKSGITIDVDIITEWAHSNLDFISNILLIPMYTGTNLFPAVDSHTCYVLKVHPEENNIYDCLAIAREKRVVFSKPAIKTFKEETRGHGGAKHLMDRAVKYLNRGWKLDLPPENLGQVYHNPQPDEPRIDPITMEPLEYTNDNPPIRTYCGHTFLLKSIISWTQKKNNCPICRRFLDVRYNADGRTYGRFPTWNPEYTVYCNALSTILNPRPLVAVSEPPEPMNVAELLVDDDGRRVEVPEEDDL